MNLLLNFAGACVSRETGAYLWRHLTSFSLSFVFDPWIEWTRASVWSNFKPRSVYWIVLLSVMLFRHFSGCIYRSLREACTTSQCTVLLVSRCFAICSNERKPQHSTQVMTMTYGPKKYNPSSCVAPRRKLAIVCGRITNFPSCVARQLLYHLIMNCDRMTDFPSCVARRLLCHLILNCDHNTTLSSYEAHICVENLHQIWGDEAIKCNRSIVQLSIKSGERKHSFVLRKQITSCTEFCSDFDQW